MTVITAAPRIETPQLLSLLWVFLMLNFIYCDVIALHDGAVLGQLLQGKVGGMTLSPVFFLLSSLLMEVPIALVLVSRLARRSVSRVANLVAGGFMTLVQASSLFVSTPSWSYLFFSAIEIATLLLILVLAIRWKKPMGA